MDTLNNKIKLRKKDFTPEQWTELDRARERIYDAKRRANKVKNTTFDQRREARKLKTQWLES